MRTDQSTIYTLLSVEGEPVKLKLVREDRVAIAGAMHPALPVPVLSRTDLYAQKLLANADRGLDTATKSRDTTGMWMVIQGSGDIPAIPWTKPMHPTGTCSATAVARAGHQL